MHHPPLPRHCCTRGCIVALYIAALAPNLCIACCKVRYISCFCTISLLHCACWTCTVEWLATLFYCCTMATPYHCWILSCWTTVSLFTGFYLNGSSTVWGPGQTASVAPPLCWRHYSEFSNASLKPFLVQSKLWDIVQNQDWSCFTVTHYWCCTTTAFNSPIATSVL